MPPPAPENLGGCCYPHTTSSHQEIPAPLTPNAIIFYHLRLPVVGAIDLRRSGFAFFALLRTCRPMLRLGVYRLPFCSVPCPSVRSLGSVWYTVAPTCRGSTSRVAISRRRLTCCLGESGTASTWLGRSSRQAVHAPQTH